MGDCKNHHEVSHGYCFISGGQLLLQEGLGSVKLSHILYGNNYGKWTFSDKFLARVFVVSEREVLFVFSEVTIL